MSSVRIDHEGAVYLAAPTTDEHQRREIEARERARRVTDIRNRLVKDDASVWDAAIEIEALQRRILELESQ